MEMGCTESCPVCFLPRLGTARGRRAGLPACHMWGLASKSSPSHYKGSRGGPGRALLCASWRVQQINPRLRAVPNAELQGMAGP